MRRMKRAGGSVRIQNRWPQLLPSQSPLPSPPSPPHTSLPSSLFLPFFSPPLPPSPLLGSSTPLPYPLPPPAHLAHLQHHDLHCRVEQVPAEAAVGDDEAVQGSTGAVDQACAALVHGRGPLGGGAGPYAGRPGSM